MENDIVLEPPLYFAEDHVFDVNFHPTSDLLACCLITGEVKILAYNSDDVKEVGSFKHHKKSCRSSIFSPEGHYLATGSKDKSIGLIDSAGKLIQLYKKAHEDAISRLYFLGENILGSGDDTGTIKIWDLRSKSFVFDIAEHDEAITDMTVSGDKFFLVSTGLDGCLSVADLRKPNDSKEKLYAMSDCMEEDLLSLAIVKDGRFVLASSSEGVIFLFKWDWFGDCKDRLPGHPNSIDAMVKVDEHTVITGSEDGFLRGVSIYPNKIINILGKHSEDDEHFPIQRISISHCRKFAASCSHDSSIKFYDVSSFLKGRAKISHEGDEQFENEITEEMIKLDNERKKSKKKIKKGGSELMEMEDNDDDENNEQGEKDGTGESSDDDSNEDDEEILEKGKKNKKKSSKINLKTRMTEIEKEKKAKFFDGI